jgi:galactose mutarotase-like enzyme
MVVYAAGVVQGIALVTFPAASTILSDIPSVKRRALAIEPMTCPPNAFRSGEALVTLEPGESHTAAWGLQPRSR